MDNVVIAAVYVQVNKIQTTIDGGARITLDVDSSSPEAIQAIMAEKLSGNGVLFATFVKADSDA